MQPPSHSAVHAKERLREKHVDFLKITRDFEPHYLNVTHSYALDTGTCIAWTFTMKL